MRISFIIFEIMLTIASLSGCSILLARDGKYSDVLKEGTPRQDVIAKLGPPHATVNAANVWREDKTTCIVDSYVLTGKIQDQNLSMRYMEMNVGTFGLGEFILFPLELIRSIYTSFTTKDVLLMYCRRQGVEVFEGILSYR